MSSRRRPGSSRSSRSSRPAAVRSRQLGRGPEAARRDDEHAQVLHRPAHPGLEERLGELTGDTDAAEEALREELRLCGELVVRPFATEGLLGLAEVAVVRGDVERAARLLGAAAAQRCEPEDPVDARLEATFFEPARTLQGADAWNAAARGGGALNFDDAVAYALEESRA